ncbi:hypothetical protein BU17DRAFT_61486 [Hysterangium stoloniferum]|nr:hypothetical protein BU17DRAFT_61486 [Hysterangium stoloniferum]
MSLSLAGIYHQIKAGNSSASVYIFLVKYTLCTTLIGTYISHHLPASHWIHQLFTSQGTLLLNSSFQFLALTWNHIANIVINQTSTVLDSDSDLSGPEPFDSFTFPQPFHHRIPHLPLISQLPPQHIHHLTSPSASKLSNKIVLPSAGPLTANSLKVWLGSCEDGFKNYEDTHGKKLIPKTHIHLTGAALIESQIVEWWASGKVEFLALPSWEAFIKKVKDHFMPVNWKMDVLEQFYSCSQGKCNFCTFAMDLTQCLDTLPSATISMAIYKHHILFYSHPLLYLHIGTALLLTMQLDINYTSSTGIPLLMSSTGNATSPASLTTPPKFLPITEDEKAAFTAI